jgi:hypothetical protein
MSVTFLVLVLIGVVCMGLVASYLTRRASSKKKATQITALDKKAKRLEDRYFKAAAKGDTPIRLARVYSQMDLSLLQSIFSSKNITTNILYGNTNNVRTGMAISGYNDTVIMVLTSDYEAAKLILFDYIKNRKNNTSKIKTRTKVRNVIETLMAGAFANPNDQLPEVIEDEQQLMK